jgi:hypothetical protein
MREWEHIAAWTIPIVYLMVGVFCLRTGSRTAASERAFVAESARARSEWNSLRQGAAEAKRAGVGTEAYLRSCGYRVEGVVSWVVHDLERGIGTP